MTRPPTRPVAPQVSNSQPACSSTDENRNQGNWICWDASNDKLQMGPNLSIENFVIRFFHKLQELSWHLPDNHHIHKIPQMIYPDMERRRFLRY